MDTSPFSASTDDNWVSRAGGLPKYIRGVAHALLRTGRAKDESSAIRLAVGAIQNWASGRTTNGKGHVHPAVQAAAAAALAEWNAKRVKAHANEGDAVTAVDLAGAWNGALHPRVAAGASNGGQFGSVAASSSKPPAKPAAGKAPAKKAPAKKPPAKPVPAKPAVNAAQLKANRAEAAKLHAEAQADRVKAKALLQQVSALNKQIAANQVAAAKAAAAAKAKVHKAGVVAGKGTAAKATPKKTAKKRTRKPSKRATTAQLKARRTTLRAKAASLMTQAKALDAQASHLKLAGDSPAVELAAKTPAPERAAGRKKLAAEGDALADGSEPIPDLAYLKKAIRSVGRLDPSKRPALKALIRKRARELGAMDEPGVKGTWAFEGANDGEAAGWTVVGEHGPELEFATPEGIELAMMTKPARVRGPGDVACKRTAPGEVTVTHKPTGMRIGKLTPAQHGGWQGTHATGKATPPSGSMAGALSGLIGVHNKVAASMPDAKPMHAVQAHAAHEAALELAGTPAVTSGDGPRMTVIAGGKPAKDAAAGRVQAVYKKLIARGMKPGQAMALAKRAAQMHARATAKAA